MRSLGIYIHIPYCLSKCRYCDFTSGKICDAAIDPDTYADKVCREIETVCGIADKKNTEFYLFSQKYQLIDRSKYYVDTIYFGGGTPTCIGVDLLGRILLCIKHNFNVSPDAEISIEANPETINLKKAEILRYFGFNRISMGVQSLNDDILKIMGRVHNADRARDSFGILRAAGFDNINLDLMFGVPGQTKEIWNQTLNEVLEMNPEHVSFYSLQLEEGTPFYEDYRSGKIDIPSWSENRDMYHTAIEKLKAAGFHHYEISNASKPGKECRHNLKYWSMQPYVGFGTSAHSFVDDCRFYNTSDLMYTRVFDDNKNLETDKIFTQLRLVDGYDFGLEFCNKYKKKLKQLSEEKYIIQEGTKLKFTELGLDMTNIVIERLMNFDFV